MSELLVWFRIARLCNLAARLRWPPNRYLDLARRLDLLIRWQSVPRASLVSPRYRAAEMRLCFVFPARECRPGWCHPLRPQDFCIFGFSFQLVLKKHYDGDGDNKILKTGWSLLTVFRGRTAVKEIVIKLLRWPLSPSNNICRKYVETLLT